MPTSSIFADFNIIDPETAEAFVAALEASEKDIIEKTFILNPTIKLIEDPDEIKSFFKGYSD